MTHTKIQLFLLLFGVWLNAQSQDGPKRVALVIGVQNYTAVAPLKNPLNDAKDMAAALRSKNFKVFELYDPQTKREIQDAIKEYYFEIKENNYSAGLIYYSGHGMQVDGSNYFIPARANLEIKADLDDQCLKMDFLMQALEEAGNPLNILILDACRNNPFRSFTRSGESGLSMVSAPKGSYIVYATKPGSVASDGIGRNGLFTSKLLEHIDAPDLSIEEVFKRVARDVSAESGDSQRPWIASDYTGDFYFTAVNAQEPDQKIVDNEVQGKSDDLVAKAAPQATKLSDDEARQKAVDLFKENKFIEGLSYLIESAEKGNGIAQYELGMLFLEPRGGISQDFKKAFIWISKAAENNVLDAEFKLGELYAFGEGIQEDFARAVSWYQRAASKNHPQAQYELGIMYMNGRGVAKSEPTAVDWFIKSGEQNYTKALNQLGEIYLMGTSSIGKSRSEAIKWFRKSAALGDTWAKETLNSLGVRE